MQNAQKQTVSIVNREELSVNGITKVLGFDGDYVLLECELGRISIEGNNLAIESLAKDGGDLQIIGNITAIVFSETKKARGGMFAKLLK